MDQKFIARKKIKILHKHGYGSSNNPSISGITPTNGPVAGGTAFTLTGRNFRSGIIITIGGALATSIVFIDSGTLTGISPSGNAGAQDIVVINSNNSSGTLVRGFTYNAPDQFLELEDGTFILTESGEKIILES